MTISLFIYLFRQSVNFQCSPQTSWTLISAAPGQCALSHGTPDNNHQRRLLQFIASYLSALYNTSISLSCKHRLPVNPVEENYVHSLECHHHQRFSLCNLYYKTFLMSTPCVCFKRRPQCIRTNLHWFMIFFMYMRETVLCVDC